MAQQVLLAVDTDREILTAMERDLARRFAADYRIVTAATPEAAFAELNIGDQVAVVMAGQSLTDTDGVEFLNTCHQLHPAAKRVLLITYGDIAAGRAGVRAMALGLLDDYLNKPWGDPELELYRTVSELLSQRARAAGATVSQPVAVRVVGPQWSARSHQLRDLLTRNSVAHRFYDIAQPEGRQLLRQAGVAPGDQPIVLLFDGRVLVDPPNESIAEALGVQTKPTSTRYDLTVIGGGPAGLTAAMYAASEGLATLLLEREALGGQAGTTSLIRSYLGFPRGISGRELASRAVEQALFMGAEIAFIQATADLDVHSGDLLLTLADGSLARSDTVVIATGVTLPQARCARARGAARCRGVLRRRRHRGDCAERAAGLRRRRRQCSRAGCRTSGPLRLTRDPAGPRTRALREYVGLLDPRDGTSVQYQRPAQRDGNRRPWPRPPPSHFGARLGNRPGTN